MEKVNLAENAQRLDNGPEEEIEFPNENRLVEEQGQLVLVSIPPEDSIERDDFSIEDDADDVYEELFGKPIDTESDSEDSPSMACMKLSERLERATDSKVVVNDAVACNTSLEPEDAAPLNEVKPLVESEPLAESEPLVELKDSLQVSSEEDPIHREGTWDFPLPTIKSNKVKRVGVKGRLFEKLKQCKHELIEDYCNCVERKKFIICRLCHSPFCTEGCLERIEKNAAAAFRKSLQEGNDEIDHAVPGPSNKYMPKDANATTQPPRKEKRKTVSATREVGRSSGSYLNKHQSKATKSQQKLHNTRQVVGNQQERCSLSPLSGSSTTPANAHAVKSTVTDDTPGGADGIEKESSSDKIRFAPDIPIGIKLPGIYIDGDTFSEFSVVAVENFEHYIDIGAALQNCLKEQLTAVKEQDLCAVQYQPAEEGSPKVWCRGIITEVYRAVSVYLVDFGVDTVVSMASIYKLPEEYQWYRPFAIRMKCLNVKEEGADAKEVEEHFKSLVKSQTIKIRITHKNVEKPFTYGGYVYVLYLGKWFDVGVLLKTCYITDIVSEGEIAANRVYQRFPIVDSQISECQPPIFGKSTKEITVEAFISNVESINEFYVITEKLWNKRILIEEKLQDQHVKSIELMQELSQSLFVMFDNLSDMWVRVKVLEVSSEPNPANVVVFKLDYGETVKVPIDAIKRVPYISREPGCVYKCALQKKPTLGINRRNARGPVVKDESLTNLQDACRLKLPVNIRFKMEAMNTHIVQVCGQVTLGMS